jgi:hypothetical protein
MSKKKRESLQNFYEYDTVIHTRTQEKRYLFN